MAARAPGPLAGLRVVELSHVMAGPVCGLMLADLGADVVKVERLPAGDDARRMAPPTVGGESAAFMMMNRNKRGIALDLRRPEAIAAVRRLALFEAGIVQTYWQSAICLATGASPGPTGSAHPLNAPYQAFETSDGWITVGAANQRNWEALTEAIGARALAGDPRFADNAARRAHLGALEEALAPLFRRRTTAEWLAALDAAGVPAGPVLSIAEMLDHPQTRARDMAPEVVHAAAGRLRTLGLPVKLSATPGSVRRGAPVLGEHTREVLAEHGYDGAEIDALVASGAALDGAPGAATPERRRP